MHAANFQAGNVKVLEAKKGASDATHLLQKRNFARVYNICSKSDAQIIDAKEHGTCGSSTLINDRVECSVCAQSGFSLRSV